VSKDSALMPTSSLTVPAAPAVPASAPAAAPINAPFPPASHGAKGGSQAGASTDKAKIAFLVGRAGVRR